MLRSSLSEEDYFESLNFIVHEAERLSQMSKQLLLLADVEEGDFEFEDIEVAHLKEKIVRLFEFRSKKKGVTLSFDSNLQTIRGCFPLLESLISNLIENSIRACAEGTGKVNVSMETMGTGFKLMVKDNGRGIPKEKLEQVMEPFYRTDKARSRADGGTGLGLALCKQIVLLHKGSITIESEENKGTRVMIIFTTS